MKWIYFVGVLFNLLFISGNVNALEEYSHPRLSEIRKVAVLPIASSATRTPLSSGHTLFATILESFLSRVGFEVTSTLKIEQFLMKNSDLMADFSIPYAEIIGSMGEVYYYYQGKRTYWEEFPVQYKKTITSLQKRLHAEAVAVMWAYSKKNPFQFVGLDGKLVPLDPVTHFKISPKRWEALKYLAGIILIDLSTGEIIWGSFTSRVTEDESFSFEDFFESEPEPLFNSGSFDHALLRELFKLYPKTVSGFDFAEDEHL